MSLGNGNDTDMMGVPKTTHVLKLELTRVPEAMRNKYTRILELKAEYEQAKREFETDLYEALSVIYCVA